MGDHQKEKGYSEDSAESEAIKRLKAIFENPEDYNNANVWKAFFLSEDFLQEQYSEVFVNYMTQYLSYWRQPEERRKSNIVHRFLNAIKSFFQHFKFFRFKNKMVPSRVCLPTGFLTELAIAYALTPDQGQSIVDVSNTFPARETVGKCWNAEIDKMGYSPEHILRKPDYIVRMRAFYDYLQLRHMNVKNEIRLDSKGSWSKILLKGQARCLYEQNTGEGNLYEEHRGECLIALLTFWIQTEPVPKCVLECMYQEYNLKSVEYSKYKQLYVPLKQEILRQYPDIEHALYDDGTRTQKIEKCIRELARIVSDNHSNYDKGIYEETEAIKDRIQTLFASSEWQELQYDPELFDKIFSQIHSRHVMPISMSKKLIELYSQEEQWKTEGRTQKIILEGLIPSLGFNRRIREIEGLPVTLNQTGVDDIGGSNPDFWQYYLTWGYGLSNACEENGKRPHKYNQDQREYLPAYMERTYYPSFVWRKCFTRFDEARKEIVDPVHIEYSLPDQRTLKVEFHLHYVLYWINDQPIQGCEYIFDDFQKLTMSLEKVELFFFLLAITSIRRDEYDKAVAIVEKWLQKTPLYPQTIPDVARLLVERCCKGQEKNAKVSAVYYMEQEHLCIRVVVADEKAVFYYLNDFVWQEFRVMATEDRTYGKLDGQLILQFLQELKQPMPESLGAVSLEGLEPGEKAAEIIAALKWHGESHLTESYCVLRYGAQKQSERVLYCATNMHCDDLIHRNEENAGHYAFSYKELDKKIKEKHTIVGCLGWGGTYTPKEICAPKPFAIGESGTYYYYQAFHMCRGDSLAALLPKMFELDNVTEVENFRGYLSISRLDGHLEYCYGEKVFQESVHGLGNAGTDFLTAFTETDVLRELVSWLDRIFAAYETVLQQVRFVLRYQPVGGCLVEVVNRMKHPSAETFDEQQMSANETFVWKNVYSWEGAVKRLKDVIIWYLESGTYGCRLQSSSQVSVACLDESGQITEETIWRKTE